MGNVKKDLRTNDWLIQENSSGQVEFKYNGTVKVTLDDDDGILHFTEGYIDPNTSGANMLFYAKETASKGIVIYANNSDNYSNISIGGADDILYKSGANKSHIFQDTTTTYHTIDKTSSLHTTDATSQTAWDFNLDSVTTGKGILARAGALTSGNLIEITADEDTVTTGKIIQYYGGVAENQPLWRIDKWAIPAYFDDFLGDALRDEWAGAAVGAGTIPTILSDGTNGIVDLAVTTNATNDSSTLTFGEMNYNTNQNSIIEAYVKVDDVSECDTSIGFYKDADEYAFIFFDQGSIFYKSDDGGGQGPESTDTTQTASDNTYVHLMVELLSTETANFYVNGTRYVGTTGAVTANNMYPYLYQLAATTNPSTLSADYVKIYSDRE